MQKTLMILIAVAVLGGSTLATETRVLTMGDNNMILLDEANIVLFPSRLIDYPNLWAYARELYQWPGVAETIHFDHVVRHYHYSHDSINPHRIIPINPIIDWSEPHGREALKAA